MKKKLLSALLAIVLCLSAIPPVFGAGDYIAAVHTKSNGSPYYIMVNRTQNTITVYTLDDNGYYTVPYKAMICSTGTAGNATPTGTFSLAADRLKWRVMLGDVYSQYSVRFNGAILFHSVCYSRADPSSLMLEQYNMLGNPASHGCVRLQVMDAKWIFDNCPAGTKVTVYNGTTPGALGKPQKLVSRLTSGGWEPSDPDPRNPWRGRFALEIALNKTSLNLESGDQANLTATYTPVTPGHTVWASSNTNVATVDANGKVTARNEGTARITASYGNLIANCIVNVTGNLLPLKDVEPGSWYYQPIRYVYEHGLLQGTSNTTFEPNSAVTRAMATQIIYSLSGAANGEDIPLPTPSTPTPSTPAPDTSEQGEPAGDDTAQDNPAETVAEEAEAVPLAEAASVEAAAGIDPQAAALIVAAENAPWYQKALNWAAERGLVDGMAAGFLPNRAISRQEFAVMLFRMDALKYGTKAPQNISFSSFRDGNSVYAFAETGMGWAVANNIMSGNENKELQPTASMTRAELAVMLQNYTKLHA